MLPPSLAGHSITRITALAVLLEGAPIPDDPEELRLECGAGPALRVSLASDRVRMTIDAAPLSDPYGVVEHIDMADHDVLRALVGQTVSALGVLRRRTRTGVIGLWIRVDAGATVYIVNVDFGMLLTSVLPAELTAEIVLAPWASEASDA